MRAEIFEEPTLFAGGVRYRFVKYLVDDMCTELPVGFELRFIEKLICRGLVREVGVAAGIVPHVRRFVARERGLQVDQKPFRGSGVDQIVADGADGMVPLAPMRPILLAQTVHIYFDFHAKVDPNLSDRISQI